MPRSDVIVLGGGIIGCALAEELARRGQRVMVIERGHLGAEASTAAAGILAAQMDLAQPGPVFELCQAARRLYPGWVRRLQRASDVDVELRVRGILYAATTAAQDRAMAARASWQRRLGLRVEHWAASVVRRREPALDGAVRSGWWFPNEADLDVVRLMEALIRACREAGVVFREGMAVRRLLVKRRRVDGAMTDHGTLSAPIIVNCLGSWANMGGAFPLRLPVEPVRGQIIVFRARPGLIRRAMIAERAYVVQRPDGRLILGSTLEHAGYHKALTVEGMHKILCGIRQLSHTLTHCTFLTAWAGLRPWTPDGLPILGATPIDGLYVATGHFRHGILLAPITAQVMAQLILRGRAAIDLTPFSPQRFW